MSIKPTAWMQELPKKEGVERAVRTTTVKEVADDWEYSVPLYTADGLRAAVLAEREACVELCLEHSKLNVDNASAHEFGKQAGAAICATAIRARGEA